MHVVCLKGKTSSKKSRAKIFITHSEQSEVIASIPFPANLKF